MNIPYLISQVFRGTWFLYPQIAIGFADFAANLIAGKLSIEETKKPFRSLYRDESGAKGMISASEDENRTGSIFDAAPKNSVAILPLKGQMFKEDTLCSYGTETIASYIREAADHENIISIVLDVDTGGGAVDSVSPILDANKYAKEKVPVVASVEMGASAGYYGISNADLIIPSNNISSALGSIGVMFSYADIQPYWEKQGYKFHTVYAPESDHKNLPFEELLKGNYDLIKKEMLSPIARQFQKDVRENRKGKVDITVKGILNGRMLFATDAIKHGLADELGNMDHAIKRALELAKKR